jgi:hypothetical protein
MREGTERTCEHVLFNPTENESKNVNKKKLKDLAQKEAVPLYSTFGKQNKSCLRNYYNPDGETRCINWISDGWT